MEMYQWMRVRESNVSVQMIHYLLSSSILSNRYLAVVNAETISVFVVLRLKCFDCSGEVCVCVCLRLIDDPSVT